MPLTVALLYTRVSTDDQAAHGFSLDTQLAECRGYVIRQGWSIGAEFSDVMSGQKDTRPQYQSLLAKVRELRANGTHAAVVVADLDRFGRRLLEQVRAREELKALGVSTHSVRQGGEVSDLVANILASVAQEEVRHLAERVRAAREHLRVTGWKPPGRAPLGYRWRKPTETERSAGAPSSVLDVDHQTADTVVEMFGRVADGLSIRKTAAWLTTLPPALRGDRVLQVVVVSDLLRAPVYVARSDTGDPDILARPVSRWPALITDDLWLAVQERIAGHQRFAHQTSGRFLLTGFFRCPWCGYRVTGHKNPGGPRYRCAYRERGPMTCPWSILTRRIDEPVIRSVGTVLRVVEAVDRDAITDTWKRIGRPDRDEQHRVAALKREIASAKDQLLRATQAYVDGAIDAMSYELTRDRAQETIVGAEIEMGRIRVEDRPVLPDLDVVLHELAGWADLFESRPVIEQREVLGLLVDSVDVRYERPKPGHRVGRYHVGVNWTPLGEALAAIGPS